jgi:hypothetical protein
VTQRFLSHADLAALVAAHRRVIAPVRAKDDARQTDYLPIQALADAALGAALPRRSLKEYFLPPTEVLLSYRQTKEGVEIKEVPTQAQPQVILFASPCDAAALEVVDKVMNYGLDAARQPPSWACCARAWIPVASVARSDSVPIRRAARTCC